MSTLLRDYMPDITSLSIPQILAIRQRLVDDLAINWPTLDTRPTSVAGDMIVSPDATLIAKAEAAVAMIQSDIDLANVASGTVYNYNFVKAYLANFGVTPSAGSNATGTIALVFNSPQNYIIPANTVFTFGGSSFQITAGSGDPVVIYANDPSNRASASNQWVLHQTDVNAYTVLLPVTGAPGSSVSDGTAATYQLTIPQLIGVTAAGDFNSGKPVETIQAMATRAQQAFAAPSLVTRSGALSFLLQNWPQLVNSYVTVTGDAEMQRAGTNPLGIVDGAMDVFVKSQLQYSNGSVNIPLVYDTAQGGWTGALSLPAIPACFAVTGIFQTANFENKQSKNIIYSQSLHPTTDSLAVAFSKYEELGVFVTDQVPTNFTEANIGNVSSKSVNNVSLNVTGTYNSHMFNTSPSRSVIVSMGGAATWDGLTAVQATVLDTLTSERGTVYFIPNAPGSPSGGMIATDSPDYARMLNGLQLTVVSPNGGFTPADYAGAVFSFAFNGRSAFFTINYLYDPALTQVDTVLQASNNRPIGIDVVTRSFMPCYISRFTVNYRIGFGSTFDAVTAQTNIFNYLSSISGPDVYEEAQIGQIVMNAGASGLISVDKEATFFPSLAKTFVSQAGVQSAVPRFPTSTLQVPSNSLGLSEMNTTFVIGKNTIIFNATVR